MRRYWNLKYWDSGEWQAVNERLHDMEKANVRYNPTRNNFLVCLRNVSPDSVRVVFLFQDPYPDLRFATGSALSIPDIYKPHEFPGSLRTVFKEYTEDLHYPSPSCGDLSHWESEGVLLWNVVPTCTSGVSLSHDWPEYEPLNQEVLSICAERGAVFCFVGGVAKRYLSTVACTGCEILTVAHPSPRANAFAKTPFKGSRIFSTINDKLVSNGREAIDWRLD